MEDICVWCNEHIENNTTQRIYHPKCHDQKVLEGNRRRATKSRPAREIPTQHSTYQEEYFWSLVKPKKKAKKRRCLRCRNSFESIDNRVCASCHGVISRRYA